jgi:hypothetical protein
MTSPISTILSAALLALSGAAGVHAQTMLKQRPADPEPQSQAGATAAPQTTANLPDACKLLQQSDLEAVFPGRPITAKGPTLSPVYKGPQYNESCMYTVKLPSPTSKMEQSKFASVTIVKWGGQVDGRDGSAATFASIRSTQEKLAADPKLNVKVEPVSGVADEAIMDTSSSRVAVRVRKADLVYVVSLDIYSPQTQPNTVALAAQVAKRWSPNVGMIEAATSIAPNSTVDIPEDKRVSTTAPADRWPDACALLTPEDVRSVFGDMTVDQPRKYMGQLTHESRIDRVEDLPKPIGCEYQAKRSDLKDGQRKIVTNSIKLSVSNVAASTDFAKKHYESSRKVGDAKTEVAGVGDEASISPMNTVYIRKGVLTVELRVAGDMRDRALYDDATRRANELAKRVSVKLP